MPAPDQRPVNTREWWTPRARVRRGAILVGAVAAVMGAAAGLRAGGVRINLSPSVPLGLYVAEPLVSVTPRVGWLVAVCLPRPTARWGRARGYLIVGDCGDGIGPVGKPVFAVAGDTVVVSAHGLSRGGVVAVNSRPLLQDTRGRALPHLAAGRYVVGPGEIWLLSTFTASSWDSRYYGPVGVNHVVARLRPLWPEAARRAE